MSPDWVNPRTHEGEVTVERAVARRAQRLHRLRGEPGPASADLLRCQPGPLHHHQDLRHPELQRRHHANLHRSLLHHAASTPIPAKSSSATSDVNAWYNSMVLTLRRPMRHGLEFTANYTFSKAFDGAQVAGNVRHVQWHRLSHRSLQPQARIRAFGSRPAPTVRGQRRMDALREGRVESARPGDSGWLGVLHHRDHVHRPAGNAVYHRRPEPAGWRRDRRREPTPVPRKAAPAGWPRNSYTAPGFHNVDFRLGRQFAHRRTGEVVAHRRSLQSVQPHERVGREHHRVLLSSRPGPALAPATPTLASFPTRRPRSWRTTSTSNLIWGPRQLQVSGRMTF